MPSSSPTTRWVDVSFAVVETPEIVTVDQRSSVNNDVNNEDDNTNEKDSGSEATLDDMPPLTDMPMPTQSFTYTHSASVSVLLPTAAATLAFASVLTGNEIFIHREVTAAATSPSRKRKKRP